MAAIPVDPREELERLERKHAENPEGRYFVPLADAYRRSGDLPGAIDLLRAGLARHPDYLSAHVVLGRCYADSGDPEAAEAEFRYILSLDPQNLIALRTLGDIALIDGRLREAERWYQDLLAVDPMNDDARTALQQLRTSLPSTSGDEEQLAAAQPVGARHGLDESMGDMVEPRTDDDRETGFDDDSDVVVTETIAELYTRQGFYDRAADIYRELIRRRGGDEALEAKLRRVESLSSGAHVGGDTSDVTAPTRDVSELAGLDAPSPAAETADVLEWATPSTAEHGLTTAALDDSIFPLMGPVGGPEGMELDRPEQIEEIGTPLPPAYDFSVSSEGDTDRAASADDFEDLLIDPYADPFAPVTPALSPDLSARSFGSSSGWSGGATDAPVRSGSEADAFADSFTDGFPALDEPAPDAGAAAETTIPGLPGSDQPALPSSGGVAIGAFLRSVATWSRSAPRGEADPVASATETPTSSVTGGSEWSAHDADLRQGSMGAPAREEDATHTSQGIEDDARPVGAPVPAVEGRTSGSPGPDADVANSADSPPGGWLADLEFDAALGHSHAEPSPGARDSSGTVPAEPSGADDLQLVSGVDDLFPWEIPVPEPGSQQLPPVQPLNLDPGYPFDDAPRAEAPFVDETVHSERFPSEAVDPSAPSDADRLTDGTLPSSNETASLDADSSPDSDRAGTDASSSQPADAQDDDDLESFQAWLRSLKR